MIGRVVSFLKWWFFFWKTLTSFFFWRGGGGKVLFFGLHTKRVAFERLLLKTSKDHKSSQESRYSWGSNKTTGYLQNTHNSSKLWHIEPPTIGGFLAPFSLASTKHVRKVRPSHGSPFRKPINHESPINLLVISSYYVHKRKGIDTYFQPSLWAILFFASWRFATGVVVGSWRLSSMTCRGKMYVTWDMMPVVCVPKQTS